MQSKAVLGLPPLATRVRPTKRKTQPARDLLKRQLQGATAALSRCQGGRVLAKCQDSIEHVVPDASLGGRATSEQKDTWPEEHVLSHASLPWLDLASDEGRRDAWWDEDFVELLIEHHSAPVRDDQIISGWTFEGAEGASSLQHLGHRLSETLATRD